MSSIMKFAYNLAKGKKEIFKTKSVWWQNINYFLFDEMQKKKEKEVMNHRFYIQSVVVNCQSFSHIVRKKNDCELQWTNLRLEEKNSNWSTGAHL